MRKKIFVNVEGSALPYTRIYEVCGIKSSGEVVVHSRSLHESFAYRTMAYVLENFPDLFVSMFVRPRILWLGE